MNNFTDIINDMKPAEIVAHLDQYIIGQEEAKRSMAIAIRNRYRRSKLPKEMQEDIAPSNIIMVGPTGVGKTEIARRVSKIIKAPFVKVEATKYTEVGYVGRDVESMIRDLMEVSVQLVRKQHIEKVKSQATKNANKRILDIIVPPKFKFSMSKGKNPFSMFLDEEELPKDDRDENEVNSKREIYLEKIKRSELEDEIIEIEVKESTPIGALTQPPEVEQAMSSMNSLLHSIVPEKKKKKKMKVSEAREYFIQEESDNLVDEEEIRNEALYLAENHGIIFIDEIDKIAEANSNNSAGVSREGVQRDILPIVEGSVVKTKYGHVSTDHILFIAAGAFHVSKPEDLIPELQGRFPLCVKLKHLDVEDYVQILSNKQNSLIKQYTALMEIDHINLEFSEDGIVEIARIVYDLNESEENLGARRLVGVIEKLLKDILFEVSSENETKIIDRNFVQFTLRDLIQHNDMSKYFI